MTVAEAAESLEREAARGVRWTGVSHAARQGLQLVTALLLTRLLLPEDFGLATLIMVVVAFVDVVQDFGLSSALVQRERITQRLVSTVFWFNTLAGMVAGLVLWAASPLVVAWTGNPAIAPLLVAAAVLFVVRGLVFLPRAELSRRLDFATLSRVELITAILGAVFAVGAALLGAGVWALVLQPIVANGLLAARLWGAASWRPRFEFSWRELMSVREFSVWLALHNVLDFFHIYGAHLLISHYLPEERLGIYYLAFRITAFPAGAVADSISRVLFPYLARVIDDEQHARKSYLSIVCAIGLCVFPAVIGFAVVADLFFGVVSGSDWSDCALVAVLLTPVGLSRAISSTTGPLYQATGRTDLMCRWGSYYVVIALIAFAIGVHWGIVGVAIGYSTTVLFAYPLYRVPARLIGVRVREIAAALLKPLVLCAVMALAVLGVRATIEPFVAAGVSLGIAIATGVAVYVSSTAVFARGEMVSVLKRLAPR